MADLRPFHRGDWAVARGHALRRARRDDASTAQRAERTSAA